VGALSGGEAESSPKGAEGRESGGHPRESPFPCPGPHLGLIFLKKQLFWDVKKMQVPAKFYFHWQSHEKWLLLDEFWQQNTVS